MIDIYNSARKHGIADDDIRHAIENAMAIEAYDERTRLYIGPSRSAQMLEVFTVRREDAEVAIHAMAMRPRYQGLLPGA